MTQSQQGVLSILQLPYHEIFDAMPGYALILDNRYRIIATNRRMVEDFGEAVGKLCHEVLKHRESPCEECHVHETFAKSERHQSEVTLRRTDGTTVHAVMHTVPILNKSGEVAAVMEMATDITSQVRLRDKLADAEKRFRSLFNKVPCYITVQDRDLHIVSSNARFRQDFGEPQGGFCYRVYKHRDEECLNCPVLETFADGKEHRREEVATTIRGERKNVQTRTTPILDDEGNVEFVMEMSSDITELRQLQGQLESLGLLVGSISHGIKGVLTGLDGGIYMMNSGFAKDDGSRIERGWDMVRRNVARIRSMVMDILYYAKDREPMWEMVDPVRIATDVCATVETKAKELGIEFKTAFAPDVGEFEADAKAIHSMLVNFIENSIDACRTDGQKDGHWVEIGIDADEDHVIFTIADNGIGMDQETKERLFSLFFSSKGMEGTGLGMFISNKIAQKHGGIVVVDSEPGRGATFTIRIPRRASTETKQAAAAQAI